MHKFLSIIIPRYMESEKNVFPLLSSINNQVGIDFDDIEVIVVNDGNGRGPLNDDFLSIFDFHIAQINLSENCGPGVARQVGLDNSSGQYILFCDADDILHNVGVIGAFIHELEINVPDILLSIWLEEYKTADGKTVYLQHENEGTWVHGKVFRSQFLKSNNIRFHDTLRVHEDSYFMAIAIATSAKTVKYPAITYVWKYHSGSITRHDNHIYSFDCNSEFIRAVTMAMSEINRINPELMDYKVVQFIIYNYFTLHQAAWNTDDMKQYLDDSEKTLVKCIEPYIDRWKAAPTEYITQIYNEERAKRLEPSIETETLNAWLMRLGLIKSAEE